MNAIYWTRHTQECVDFLDDLLTAEAVPDLMRAERKMVEQGDGRECWNVTLWLTRPLTS